MTENRIPPDQFGVSFSLKQCRSFQLEPQETLNWLINEAGFRRFRLMSYWNEHEKEQGTYDFTALDAQVELIATSGGIISLCLGARQPRWPENHWPDWAWNAPKAERTEALLRFIETVVNRYKDQPAIISYQLENEALLEQFGVRPEVDRARLRLEYDLVKQLDPSRPVIMTTSTSWGVPMRQPIPDVVGFSFYCVLYNKGKYTRALHYPMLDRARSLLIRGMHRRPSFIHELQLEPWGHTAIWKMSAEDQDKSMSTQQIAINVALARRCSLPPIDLWGGEWWYWRLKQGDPSIWHAVQSALS